MKIVFATFLSLLCFTVIAATNEQTSSENDTAKKQFENKSYADAISILQKLLKEDSNNVVLLNNLAVAQISAGQIDQGLETLKQAINTSPEYSTTLSNMNQLYAFMASKAYNEALDNKTQIQFPSLAFLDIEDEPEAEPVVVADTAVSPSDSKKQLLSQFENWINAWQKSDVNQYLSYYSGNFKPADGQSYEDWRSQRRYRLKQARQTKISYTQMSLFEDTESQRIISDFIQRYESGKYKDRVHKQLMWEKTDDGWKILSEQVIEKLN